MKCSECGNCCRTLGFRLEPSFAAFVAMHGLEPEQDEVGHILVVAAKCDWYDEENVKCLHYDERPPVCREFFCQEYEEE